jgi:hypothetical protein
MNNLHRAGLTAMIAHEITAQGELVCSLEVASVLADTVIHQGRGRRKRGIYRSISIDKSQGLDFDAGMHTVLITPAWASTFSTACRPRSEILASSRAHSTNATMGLTSC